mgnify:CR=1 FL=1
MGAEFASLLRTLYRTQPAGFFVGWTTGPREGASPVPGQLP